jgi:hypothetical protein
MSDSPRFELALPAHNNQHLFSDHYLNEILPTLPSWRALEAQARPVLAQVAEIVARFTPSTNEAQAEEELIRPILKLLGHEYAVQPALKTPDGAKKPDYVFYGDKAAKDARTNQMLTDQLPQQGGYAVGDAKYWNRPLDRAIKTNDDKFFTNHNPSYQIAFYMQHSGVAWGILTNGKCWRLYHKDTAHKLDHFYEVDLQELLQSGDVRRFLYFYAFFRRAAFDEGSGFSLYDLLRASVDYAHAVGNTLKNQVYDALRHIGQGFLDYAPNKLAPDAETLQAIYDNSLIVLYRLIFILYAEARELLPVRENQQYREIYSLYAIKQEVAHDLTFGRHLLSTSARLWTQLTYLFGIINLGSPPLKVATFNAGLFDPRKHAFLDQYTVGDAHLQQAIDMLTRVNGEFIDYRDLSVRHMGTIYEGLLEFKLVPLADKRAGGAGETGWTVDLANDKGERKATGSYYTPDYIVKYIVEQTVRPVLERVTTEKHRDADKLLAVLRVNVLDPAMGSGHFLVEATEFIARFLVDLAIAPEGKTSEEADLAYWKRRVVQTCVYGVDLNPLAVELAKLSLWLTTVAKDRPLSFLDHHLRPGNSLVGGRLEHLQLGSAKKVSGQRKQPETTEQISLFGDSQFTQQVNLAVNNMWLIEENEAQDVIAVKTQEKMYDELRRKFINKYARLLNLVTATYFGVEVDAKTLQALIQFIGKNSGFSTKQFEKILQQADTIATQERFFHWELEFPEIYFDRFGRPLGEAGGFEAVIGNPPYMRQEQLAPYKTYFQQQYQAVYHGVADIFVYFFAQGLQQVQHGGRLAYISSNSWLRANFATALRHYLRMETTVEQLVDLGDNRVFEEAPDVYPAVHIVRKAAPPSAYAVQAAIFTRGEGVARFSVQVEEKLKPVSMPDQDDSGWQLENGAARAVLAKLITGSKTLDEVANGLIYYGIKTGLNEAFIIDTATRDRLVTADPACVAIIKPLLQGEDLRPWYQECEGRWLIVLPSGWTRSQFRDDLLEDQAWQQVCSHFPSLARYLEPYADKARKRCDKGEYWWELRPCDYYTAFSKPKIFWPDITKFPRFSWDDTGCYLGNTGYILVTDEQWILGYLSSRCAWFLISHRSIALGERAGLNRYRLIDQYMRSLPVRVPDDESKAVIGSLAMQITAFARDRYALHGKVRHRLHADLGTAEKQLNQKLTAWWAQDFTGLRAELQKVFNTDIPVKERDEWEAWFADQRAAHQRLTDEIIRRETELNARVYTLFHLTPEEVAFIEESTKYQYGEV